MRKLILFFFSFALASIFQPAYAWIFYKDSNFREPMFHHMDFLHSSNAHEFKFYEDRGNYAVTDIGRFGNKTTSIQGGYPWGSFDEHCLILFIDSNLKGIWELVGSDREHLWQMDDRVSSYLVFPRRESYTQGSGSYEWHRREGCTMALASKHSIYTVSEGYGYEYPLPFNFLVTDLGSFNNHASRVVVPQGGCLRIWKGIPSQYSSYSAFYNNPDLILGAGEHKLPSGINDQASSFELVGC